MSMQPYVTPEQFMRDRADFARKGIARGRSAVVLKFVDGILLVAENRSPALHKIAEIYDRIGFAAVGRYNEFENLRIAGVRLADMRGYSYDRSDVSARALANAYAQTIGSIFSSQLEKPLEVELVVAEVGGSSDEDQIYRLTYDGSVTDERSYAVMGGSDEQVAEFVGQHYRPDISLAGGLRLVIDALGHAGAADDDPRELDPDQVEVAVLDRTRRQQRKFRRLTDAQVGEILTRDNGNTTSDRGTSADETPQGEGE